MAKEICISTTPHETRLAILEDDQLAEIYYERENEYTLAGSIYKGRVTRVLPGMQSSFVDVGLERDAFLYVTDFLEEQEDSDEYASEGNGGGRHEARPQAEPSGDEPQGRSSGGERNGQERNADRGGRRPAAPQQVDAPREAAREGGRAGRERAREQAVAPLREAVPAAQDLDEKGDDESPEGTRRWRGRRGRRRGVRGGLPKVEPQTLSGAGRPDEAPAETGRAGEIDVEAPSTVESPAPERVAVLHASPSPQDEERARRGNRGRDRRPRGSREPYAQVSTLDRPAQDRSLPVAERSSLEEPCESVNEYRGEAAAPPRAITASSATAGTIVLPGESLSKYGSAPADPGVAPAPATATVPRSVRPVNYVAPKPSTLVEVSNDWDGGSVLPGETLSRYRGPLGAAPQSMPAEPPMPQASEAAGETHDGSLDAEPSGDHTVSASYDEPVSLESAPAQAAMLPEHAEIPESDLGAFPTESDSGSVDQEHSEPVQAAEPIPFAEPEVVAAAVSPEAEAGAPYVAEPAFVHAPEEAAVEPAAEEQPEPVEYEPESASASYRVQRTGPSELRLPSAYADEEAGQEEEPATPAHSANAYAEASGEFAGAFETHETDQASHASAEAFMEAPGEVPEFSGQLAPVVDFPAEPVNHHSGEPDPRPAGHWPAPALQILHADGTVDLAAAHEASFAAPASETFRAEESFEAPSFEPNAFESHGFEPQTGLSPAAEAKQAEAEQAAGSGRGSEFSDLVDQMQGFAPGDGLLEEETIEEEEYDFEPLHAHADDGDQEDLEEETLDQQIEPSALSDAVRESHLEQRVQRVQEAQRSAQAPEQGAFATEEDEAAFGYEEVEEGDEDFEEDGEESVQSAEPGEPQRAVRPDDRARRGRSNGRPGGRNGGRGRSAQSQPLPIISELLKQGQEILVQIAKEPIAKKGARITSHIALPGRFLVFMPTVSHVGVSRKIASDEERQRLKRILISEKGDSSGGFIVRTAAEGASEEDLRADLRFLISLWTEIKQRSDTAKAPALIYHDLNLIERILRDQVSSNFSTIWVDSEAEYERIIRFLSRFQPQLVRRVKLYTKETPLFEHFGIQEEISKALKSKVWLKSGGSIVINQTEALVAIDINTGKYVGKTSRLEDTIVKTNLDAIPEIVRQIRLRDLGGIIVIDFIDMDERKNRNKVLAALEEELKNDRAPSKVLQFNDFGLVAITRKRVKQSLERTLSVTCETCTGTGMVKSPITVCNEIYTEMRKMLKHLDGKDVMLRVHPEVVKQLKAGNGKWINELEEMVSKTIIIKSDPALHPEQFDIH